MDDEDVPKKSYIDTVINERKRFTPKSGFNVCTFDDFGRPGEMLELIAHTDTTEKAERVKQALEGKGETVYIYGDTDETD